MKLILTGISICTRFFCIQWSIKTRKLKKEIGLLRLKGCSYHRIKHKNEYIEAGSHTLLFY